MSDNRQSVSFRRMDQGSAADYALLESVEQSYAAGLADRLLTALTKLQTSLGGFPPRSRQCPATARQVQEACPGRPA